MSGFRIVALAVVAMMAMLAACGGHRPTVRRPGEEYLAQIKVEKHTNVSAESDIIAGLALDRLVGKRAVDEYQLNLDTQRIVSVFQKHGFFAVKVTPRIDRKGEQQILIFHVDEGPRATAKVEIVGLPPEVALEDARKLVDLRDGDPFEYDAFDLAKTPMLALVENAGYAHAVMEAAVIADKDANTATLHYAFDPGPRVTFGKIEIVGVSGSLADAARDRLTFKEGDGYSTKAVAQSQAAIYGIGMFSSVRIDADRSGLATSIPVRIQLVEALHWEARGGVGAGLDSLSYNVRLRGSLSHTGWPTPLTTLSLEARPALVILRENCPVQGLLHLGKACDAPEGQQLVEPRIHSIASAVQQDFLHPGIKAELDGGYDYVAIESYVEKGPVAQLGLSSPLGWSRLTAHVGWKFAEYTFSHLSVALKPITNPKATYPFPVDPTEYIKLGLDHAERLGAFTQTLELDLRDNPIEPTFGAYAQIKLAEGTVAAGGAYNYFQLTPELRGYAHLGGTVFAAHARYGTIYGDVPPSERYYAGGASGQRGFADRHLSPEAYLTDLDDSKPEKQVVTRGVVIGGASLFETGVEIRRHWEPWAIKAGWVVFLDGGDVTETPSQLDLGNLHWALGAGLRFFYLPIGPIRLELARRLNRTGPDEISAGQYWNLVISVGEAY